jgi:hypothetical protein
MEKAAPPKHWYLLNNLYGLTLESSSTPLWNLQISQTLYVLQNHNCMSAKHYLQTNKIHILYIHLTSFTYFTPIWKCYLYRHEISNSKSEFTKWYIWSTDGQLGRYVHSTSFKLPYIAKRNRKYRHTETEET